MKKVLFVVIFTLLLANVSMAYNYSAQDKKDFYDNFILSMFSSLNESLKTRGYSSDSTDKYTMMLQSRLDRTKLENSTWGCLSKYSPEQIIKNVDKVGKECVYKWENDFVIKDNGDLLPLLNK